PMERIAEPLRRMGAEVLTTDGHAPLRVRGRALRAIDWSLPVASAQVKSAVLLAGLRARGPTRVREPLPSPDHTERMLAAMGVASGRGGGPITLDGGQRLRALDVLLPGDFSSAAFFLVAGTLVAGSEIRLRDVGLNPTRTGALAILERMGADITVDDRRGAGGEALRHPAAGR